MGEGGRKVGGGREITKGPPHWRPPPSTAITLQLEGRRPAQAIFAAMFLLLNSGAAVLAPCY